MCKLDKIKSEIEEASASQKAASEAAADDKTAPVTDSGSDDEDDADEDAPEEDVADNPAPASPADIDDPRLERAIRAGLSVKQAKALGDELDSLVELLEAKSSQPGGHGEEEAAESPTAEEDEEIPDLPEDEDYDPALRRILELTKKRIGKLSAENRKLRSAGESANEEAKFGKMFSSLGDDYRESLGVGSVPDEAQSKARENVRRRFRVLTAGYKAEGIPAKPEDVFLEAVHSVAEARPGKSAKLAERNRLVLPRPGRDTSVHVRHEASPEEASVAAINAEIAKLRSRND